MLAIKLLVFKISYASMADAFWAYDQKTANMFIINRFLKELNVGGSNKCPLHAKAFSETNRHSQ